jgi:hypothetical protein
VELTKTQRKHLRELSGKAHERELSEALNALLDRFQEWKNGNVSPWDLNQTIHEFHDGRSRDLYKLYIMNYDPIYRAAYALAKEIIGIDEVEESCRAILQPKIDFIKGEGS